MSSPLSRAGTAPGPPAAGLGEKLDWDAFSARYFPGRKRHDLEAIAAYRAHKQGRDWRKSGDESTRPKLTLVPSDSHPAAIESELDAPALGRLVVALAADPREGSGFPR